MFQSQKSKMTFLFLIQNSKNYNLALITIDAMIFDNSSASAISSTILSFSIFTMFVSLIKQSQYFVSFADFRAIV